MIVKFLGNKGGGSAGATMDYMLGKDRDRDGAILLSGDPDLTARIADNLDFQNRYTVGVLSFEESDLEQRQKEKIMQSFEDTLLAGLERDQYDITWIEHQDKGRLELNFIIPNVELSTGKRLQPYFDQADRPLVENWKQVTNFEHGLSDPHAPDKAQAIKILNSQNLPESVKEIKQQIGTVIAEQISKGNIQNRQDVVKTLEGAGFDITRQTDKSISIKNPDGKRNIRLEGVIYENRRFGEEFRAEHSRAGQDYQETSRERYQTALRKLQRLTTKKLETNREHFREKPSNHRGATAEHSKRFAFEYTQGVSFGRSGGDISDISRDNGMARQGSQSQATGTSRTQPRIGENAIRESDIANGGISRGQGQQSLFHRSKERQESGSVHNNGQGQNSKNRKIESRFDNPFNQNFGDGEILQRNELLKQPQSQIQTEQRPQESEYAKRLHESLQRHLELVREAVERAKRNQSKTDQADRNIDQSESRIKESERAIDQSQQCYNHSKRGIEESQQHIEEKVRQEQAEQRQNSRGWSR
jgi:hypothetical protein